MSIFLPQLLLLAAAAVAFFFSSRIYPPLSVSQIRRHFLPVSSLHLSCSSENFTTSMKMSLNLS